MMKKYVLIVCGVVILAVAAIIVSQTIFQGAKDMTDMEYRTDKEPINDRFPDMPNFAECYWKANTIGKTNCGPTNYWMKGFLCLDENTFHKTLADYEWSAVHIAFPKGIDPDITCKSNFTWHINNDFQSMILRQFFIGSIYFDTTNGIVYLDVENN